MLRTCNNIAVLLITGLFLAGCGDIGTATTNGTAAISTSRIAGPNAEKCWEPPVASTLVEALQIDSVTVSDPSTRVSADDKAVLMMSAGDLEAAYSAGILVGWGKTGRRQQFAAVTGIGVSGLIAPFIFIGPAGDQQIANIFNCPFKNLHQLGEWAAAHIDEEMLANIAREHQAGRRLLIATAASQEHPSVIWDIGKIAASRHPQALNYVRLILLALVDRVGFLDPKTIPIAASTVAKHRNNFNQIGAGQEFLMPELSGAGGQEGQHIDYYLINNGKIYVSDNGDFIRRMRSHPGSAGQAIAGNTLVTSYDVFEQARLHSQGFRLTAIAGELSLAPKKADEFDAAYLRALFFHAYRLARAGRGWRAVPPGLSLADADGQSKPN